jgi:membrane protein
MASTYGAAGALIIVLVWVFYSAQIFLLGAEFAKAYSDQRRTLHQLRQTPGEHLTEYMSLSE